MTQHTSGASSAGHNVKRKDDMDALTHAIIAITPILATLVTLI